MSAVSFCSCSVLCNLRQVTQVLSALKIPKCSATTWMHHACRISAYTSCTSKHFGCGDHLRSRFFDRLKVCCFCSRNVSLTRGRPPTVLLWALQYSQVHDQSRQIPKMHVRIGPWNTLVIGVIGAVVFTISTKGYARYLRRDLRWTLVGALKQRGSVGTRISTSTSNG